jgi:hypothetical protein
MTPSLTSRSHGVQRLRQQSQHIVAKRMEFCGKIEYELLSEIHS